VSNKTEEIVLRFNRESGEVLQQLFSFVKSMPPPYRGKIIGRLLTNGMLFVLGLSPRHKVALVHDFDSLDSDKVAPGSKYKVKVDRDVLDQYHQSVHSASDRQYQASLRMALLAAYRLELNTIGVAQPTSEFKSGYLEPGDTQSSPSKGSPFEESAQEERKAPVSDVAKQQLTALGSIGV